MSIKRIGILTGGGDAPGLNAVIRAVVLTATQRYGWEVYGIREGFDGLLAATDVIDLTHMDVTDLLARGGTILGAANRGNPFARPVEGSDGEVAYVDLSQKAIERMTELGLDALICAGGDGTMAIAQRLVDKGAPIVGVPKTIDNDLAETEVTFGFDTAVRTATEALAKLQTTAESHHRVMILEVMGRDAGWIALYTGIAGGADTILIPEIPYKLSSICNRIREIRDSGRRYSLIVVAEGARPINGEQQYLEDLSKTSKRRLGGVGYDVGAALAECIDTEVRVTVLGHVQRGGQPSARDRYLATGFGTRAVHLVSQAKWGYMVSLKGSEIVDVAMQDAVRMKFVDPQGSWVEIARDLGIVFGDE